MKNTITLLFIFVIIVGYSQNKYKRADKLFEKMWYHEAAQEYENVIKEGDMSKEILQKAGDSYYFNTDMKGAYKWYDILLSEYANELDNEYIFRYAHTLQGIGENKSAEKWMKKFSERAKDNDPRSKNFSLDAITVDDISNKKPQFELKNLSINTEFSDFGPMYFKNKLVYSSAKDSSKYHTRKYHWTEQQYLNFYVGRINQVDTDVTQISEFSQELNTRYHEATLAFSPDQKRIYFTRNNFDGKLRRDDDGVNHLKLYTAEMVEENEGKIEWTNVLELPFNGENYSVGHPAVSNDGRKLYFVSDMPGTMGATDIFVVDILENNTYSQPKNLGSTVNTHGREMFPYITEKALYFASDGHLGLGGLDVFESKNNYDFSFQSPVNMGAPLNSKVDDFGYIVNEEANTGFVCSNRKSGKGDDDIYSFVRIPEPPCVQNIKGTVRDDKNQSPIADALVNLLDSDGTVINTTLTNNEGSFIFERTYDCQTSYTLIAEKVKYKEGKESFITSQTSGESNDLNLNLEKKLNELIISDNGILKIDLDIIYFDLNKHYIRKDAALELDKVVFLMNEYPNMTIKIESHTDSRGNDSYNLTLSKRRALSTKRYIISRGIDPNRIPQAIGYGEQQLINECKNRAKCSNAQHDKNRRSEFIILKM